MGLSLIEQELRNDGVMFKYTKRAPSTSWHCLDRVKNEKIYRIAHAGKGWKMLVSELPNATTKRHTRAILMGETELYWII